MDIIKDSNYYNKSVARLSMKSGALTAEDISVIKEAYGNNNKNDFYDYASKNKVLPFIAKIFSDLDLDKDYWNSIYESFEIRNKKILDLLIEVFNVFNSRAIKKIFLYENFGALLASNTPLGCFASGDIDLYADNTVMDDISKILISFGFLPKKTNASVKTVKIEYFNEGFLENGFGINVMWKPLSRLKLPFQIDINNCIQWGKLTKYKNTQIQIPVKEALMYLCLLHTSVHGYHRAPDIRLYTDTDRIALLKPDWELIANYARLDNTKVRIATSALLANKLLGTFTPNKNWYEGHNFDFGNVNYLIDRVYDFKNNYLRNEPRGLSVLLIEILSSDFNWLKASFDILLPSKAWIKEYYLQNNGVLLKGYILHWRNLFF